MFIRSLSKEFFDALKLPFITHYSPFSHCSNSLLSINSSLKYIRYSSTSSSNENKWTRSSGPGGANVNANSTKAEIRFSLSEADWLPKKVRERLQQKYSGNINNNKEFFLTSMRTRSSVNNMDDCFEKLQEILREVSLELVTEKRREFVSEDYLEEVEERKELARQSRLEAKERISSKKKSRKGGTYF
uniref:Prokaryotic-type class I peptide chain release factors domain-containing protein n=1 Tax=Meloidogyne javanica TaxID=6303 RepID=A0A915M9E7_MELJA